MTIGPKKKISKATSHTRHATWETINLKNLTNKYQVAKCTNCGSKKLAYKVCPSCGYYNKKQAVEIKTKEEKKENN